MVGRVWTGFWAALAGLCLALPAAAAALDGREDDAPSDWPTPAEAGVDPAALARFEAYAFPPDRDDETREGVRSDGVVVLRDGVRIYENYAGGYGPDTPHLTWSVSKSFVHTLYGIALQRGWLTEADLSEALPAGSMGREDWGETAAEDLLWMASGLDFREEYENSPLDSSVMEMLYGEGRADMAGFAAMQEPREAGGECERAGPGHCFIYSSGDSNMAIAALRRHVPAGAWASLPWDGLFDAIGMDSAVWETDAAGNFVGSSYVYATPRDLARWGRLYLQDGIWQGERIMPAGWADRAATPNPAYVATCGPDAAEPPERCRIEPRYGWHWWTNRASPGGELGPYWEDLPADLYFAWGHWGQKVYVIPSLGLVIARTADDRDGSFDDAEFLRLAIAAFAAGYAAGYAAGEE